ncbi:MAG: hypothetical protein EOM66_01915 [Clostridia bacterium]|nr:V-type ATP synthase subunit E family protein [Candidatus Pelethousia sp.]NCB30147.1 hypothetical protein [Clostridia bacterium]
MAKDLNNGDRLLSSILDSARDEADGLLAQARSRAMATAAEAEAEAARVLTDAENKAKAVHTDVLERSRTNAELDSRKYALAQKRAVVDEAFQEAFTQLNAMAGQEREALLTKLLVENAEGGETIYPATADEKAVAGLLSGINAKLASAGKAALQLGQAQENITGGFLLRGASYELNCSFEAILRDLREAEVSGVADILF